MKNIIRAMRLPFITATIIPVIFGATFAFYETGNFNWVTFFISLIGVVMLHLGSNVSNDYYDHLSMNDDVNKHHSMFNGGSRVIQDNIFTKKQMKILSRTLYMIGVSAGLILTIYLNNIYILILGAIGLLLGVFYTKPPLKLGYRTLGEVSIALAFGVLVVLGSYIVQTGEISWSATFVSLPLSILVVQIILLNEFPDHDADKKVGKKTLIVAIGKQKSILIFHILLVLAYTIIPILVINGILGIYSLSVFMTMPLATKIFFHTKKNYSKTKELLPANAMTINLHVLFGVLMIISELLRSFFPLI